jgi:hypothetical protein
MDNSKYYLIKRKTDQAYPLVDILEYEEEPWELELSSPVPRKPVMADYLSGARDVFTKRIADVMQAMNMEGVCFHSTEVDDTRGTIYDNYVCLETNDNIYKLMDKEQSEYEEDDDIYSFSKLVIDRKKLNKIPLNKRLCMRIYEAPGYHVYHQSVVDAVMALEPTGMYFQDIENYDHRILHLIFFVSLWHTKIKVR